MCPDVGAPRGVVKRLLMAVAALAAAGAVGVFTSLPARPLALDASWTAGSIPGILHVHTDRSDGQSGFDEIAEAARRAGLRFVVFADHADGTRAPVPPVYRSGVLCLDGAEISTTGGHYLAFDMQTAPYPLGGDPVDVVEDVRRLGGFGVVAHADSPKAELAWREWEAGFDGLELLNPDTSWRVHLYEGTWRSRLSLAVALGTYPFRPSETIAGLLTDSPGIRTRWAAISEVRRVVGIAGADAHAKLPLMSADPGDNSYSLPLPSYEAAFRTLSVNVTPSGPLTGIASTDAARILEGIRLGRLYTAVNGWASPPAFEFTATNRTGAAAAGDVLGVGGEVSLRIRHNAPPEFVTSVWRGPDTVAASLRGRDVTLSVGETPGVYRVEIRDPRHPAGPAWITSNPVYVRAESAEVPVQRPPPIVARRPLFDGRSVSGWVGESDVLSLVGLDAARAPVGSELRIRYGLGGGPPAGQFAGVAVDTGAGVAGYDQVAFTVRAERPMRLSVQMRTVGGESLQGRWLRSVFVDTTDRRHAVVFNEMRAVEPPGAGPAPLDAVSSLMFVADTTNSRPGDSGRFWLNDVRLERVGPTTR